MEQEQIDQELDRLVGELPEPLRKDWCVVPRRLLMQVFVVGILFGGSLALVVLSLFVEVEGLSWAYPVVVIALLVATRYFPWWRGDRLERQLAAARGEEPPEGA